MNGVAVNGSRSKKVLIISMSRMGDILQAIPVLSALRGRGDTHVSLLARRSFAAAVRDLGLIDELIEFDSKDIIGRVFTSGMGDFRKAISSFIERIRETEFDEVINLTFSSASALITYLARAKEKKGLTVSTDGTFYNEGLWANYFNGTVLNRTINAINIVDIFQNIAGVCSGPGDILPGLRKTVKRSPVDEYIGEHDFLCVLSPGASSENKMWPVRSFAGLIKLMLRDIAFSREELKFVLIGSSAQTHMGDEILFALRGESLAEGRVLNLIGKTGIQDLWRTISRANVLVTNDTGPMHMAAMSGVPVVNISVGPVKFQETGPYSTHSVIVTPDIDCYPCSFHRECDSHRCKTRVRPQDVLAAVRSLDQLPFSMDQGSFPLSDMNVSGFANFHYLRAVSLKGSPMRLETLPLNRQKLRRGELSRIICNSSINMDLGFGLTSVTGIIERVNRYDFSQFNFQEFFKQIYIFDEIHPLLKKALKMTKMMLEISEGDHASDSGVKNRLQSHSERLFDVDIEIARFRERGEIVAFVMGIFLSMKAANVGCVEDQVSGNLRIYRYLMDALTNLRSICYRVADTFSDTRRVSEGSECSHQKPASPIHPGNFVG